jgi:hydrophobic/amphiphilic exporter-1 (mainly G- bacteria), HAE1 family
MSRFFIERPIFANVIAIITILLGAVCLYNLPVAQYPQIVPPTIQVTTNYAGASAETVANTIGIPIEQSVNGVESSIYMQSTSGSDGSYTLTVTFAIGTDLERRQQRAAAVAAASPLPGSQCQEGQHQHPVDRKPLLGRRSFR